MEEEKNILPPVPVMPEKKKLPTLKEQRKAQKAILKMLKTMQSLHENKMTGEKILTGTKYKALLEKDQKENGKDWSGLLEQIRTEQEDGVEGEYSVPKYERVTTKATDILTDIMKEYRLYGDAGAQYEVSKYVEKLRVACIRFPDYYHLFHKENLAKADISDQEEVQRLTNLYNNSYRFYEESVKIMEEQGKKKMEIAEHQEAHNEKKAEQAAIAKKKAEGEALSKAGFEKARNLKAKKDRVKKIASTFILVSTLFSLVYWLLNQL